MVLAAGACMATVVCGLVALGVAGAIGAAAGYAAGTAMDVALGNKKRPQPDNSSVA